MLLKISQRYFLEIIFISPIDGVKQQDSYSCHADALVCLCTLAGKNDKGEYLIPNLCPELRKNKILTKDSNYYQILFNKLLATIQTWGFNYSHEKQYKDPSIIHTHLT